MSKYIKVTNFVTLFFAITAASEYGSDTLIAYLSNSGLHGEIIFHQVNSTNVEIMSKLETTLQYPDQVWSWGVRKFPVDYTAVDPSGRCELEKLGPEILRFDDDLGLLVLPGNESTKWSREMKLIGQDGIWSKSLVLTNVSNSARICATITTIQMSVEHIAEARFSTPISGSVYFRWLAPSDGVSGDTVIYSDLYHLQKLAINTNAAMQKVTKHHWKIYVTDIFKNDHHRTDENCNFLQLVFDPKGNGSGHGIGDLDTRLGRISVATNPARQSHRAVFRDEKLVLLPSDLTIPHRTLYLVLFDNQHPKNFLACTKIRHVKPLIYKTYIKLGGINGEITFMQRSKFDPTFLNFTLASAGRYTQHVSRKFAENVSAFRIHNMPPAPTLLGHVDYCDSTGSIYNPYKLGKESIPPAGFGTQDQYPLGDLSGKLQSRNKGYYHNYLLPGSSSELSGLYWDVFLPLQGAYSIAHRGLVVYTYNRTNVEKIIEKPWGCSTIIAYRKNGFYQTPIFTAQVLFRYPIVGRVLFRQPAEEPWQDTTVIFEYLIHADGSTQNNTFNHRWAIHRNAPGKDFYDWQKRCLSTGAVFNPFKAGWENNSIDEYCSPEMPGLCSTGALGARLGFLSIAGSKRNAQKFSRFIFTDSNLPLSGRHNILDKSLVIYDDFGPEARGERLACSIISGYFPRKALTKDWYGNGYEFTVSGKVEITQQSEYDITNIAVQLRGLRENSGYHIHMTPVESNLVFPCEISTVYGHWNPLKINPKLSPPPKQGTSDQYEMGDLSGKFGTLDNLTQYDDAFHDTNMPLFGLNSIIGRSIVIHKKERNAHWACSTLERGYSPNEGRELRAIASFHHPAGYAFGYIKMTQLVHSDGSQSETVIEVNLRHPGMQDRNVTNNHNWQIFVNPVGIDATVKPTNTRCVAGGYVWNPYFTQLADPLNRDLYEQECGMDNPMRCYVGDLGARLGPINLGGKRILFTDSNVPLEAPIGAIGRSIVIFGPEYSHERFSCANIEPDHNVIKYINLRKPPRFVMAKFLEEIRSILGVPEWMLHVDARKTKELHGGSCVQMIIHFKGPLAHRLELDMSRLIALGRLDAPTLYIPGYVNQKRKTTISYRTCGVRDSNDKRSKTWKENNAVSLQFKVAMLYCLSCTFIYIHL